MPRVSGTGVGSSEAAIVVDATRCRHQCTTAAPRAPFDAVSAELKRPPKRRAVDVGRLGL